jgi:hypothetical protein
LDPAYSVSFSEAYPFNGTEIKGNFSLPLMGLESKRDVIMGLSHFQNGLELEATVDCDNSQIKAYKFFAANLSDGKNYKI